MTLTSPTPEHDGALRRLVGDAAAFVGSSAGRQPHRHHDGGFDDLFSLTAADEALAERGLRRPAVRLVRDGDVLAPSLWTRRARTGSVWVDDVVDPAKALALFGDGATIVFQSLQRWWPPVSEFCRDLAHSLNHPVQANAYLTPAGAAGLDPHHDTHDVFVLQVHGSKAWTVREPVIVDPLPAHSSKHDDAARQPTLFEVELRPGDCLYLPRGFVHSARAQHEASLHLTIGVLATTASDIVQSLVERALGEVPSLRRALPALGAAEVTTADVKSVVADVICWLERVDTSEVARGVQAQRPRASASMKGHLHDLVGLASLDAGTTVVLREGVSPATQRRNDQVVIEVPGRRILAPEGVAPAVDRLLDGSPHRVGDLGDVLDEPSAMVLVRRLVREGLLATVRG